MTSRAFPTTIAAALERNAESFPDRVALVGPDGAETTFSSLAMRVRRLAAALKARGVAPGARAAILSRNRSECVEVICLAAYGYIAVPLNWRLSVDELSFIIADADPAVLFCDEAFSKVAETVAPSGAARVVFGDSAGVWSGYEDLISQTAAVMPYAEDADATACIVYTSGTTGRPKGAELRHRSLLLNSLTTVDEVLRLTDREVTLCPMPLFHVGGLWYHAFPSISAGCRTVILSEFSPAGVLEAIGKHKITNMHVVPTMLHTLLNHPLRHEVDLSSLRAIFYAGSSMPLVLLKEAMAAFPSCGFIQAYGSTEAGFVTFLSEEDHRLAASNEIYAERLSSCGRACTDVNVGLVDAWEDADGVEIGEIAVASDRHMVRYWRNPMATAATFSESSLRTGDLGRIDADGYVYILDRKNDMIVTGGENVYPREVEDVLLENPAIAEAAVFDLPDEKWVQRVVAAVVLKPGTNVTADEIVARARQQLAGYKCPKEIRFLEELPRNPAGKVLRKALRSSYNPNKD